MEYRSKKHVLLVGGDSLWLNNAKNALQSFETSWVDQDRSAIALLESNQRPVDALLADTTSGSSLLKWIRMNREELPVIIMPSQNLDQDAFFLELGALSVVRPSASEKLTSLLDVYFALAPQ